MLRDHANRVSDGHRAMAKAAGMEETIGSSEGEEMGDLIVTGDIHVTQSGDGEASLPFLSTRKSTAPQPATPQADVPAWMKAATIAAALMGMGGTGFGLATLMNRPPATAEADESMRYGLDLLPPDKSP